MTTKSKTKNKTAAIEWILTKFGITVIFIASFSSIFYAIVNQRFITGNFTSLFYYLSSFIILAGGLSAGYITTKTVNKGSRGRLFAALLYALLAGSLYLVYELMRISLQNTLGDFSYPYGMYIFYLGPIVAVAITFILAVLLQLKTKNKSISSTALVIFIVSFVIYHLYSFADLFYRALINPPLFNDSYIPLWLSLLGIIVQPFVVATVSYLLIANIKNKMLRLTYSAAIASINYWLVIGLWELRTDVTHNSTMVFQAFVTVISLLITIIVILKIRKLKV